MKRFIAVSSFLLVVGLALVGAYILIQLRNNVSPVDTSADVPGACYKLGINYANYDISSSAPNQKAEELNMGYMLLIAQWPGQQYQLADDFNDAINRGITPILRLCTGNDCSNYDTPTEYVELIRNLSDLVGRRTFYVIAGPNEPLGERWFPGTQNYFDDFNFSDSEMNDLGKKNADFMNGVIDGINNLGHGNIKILSPVFNLTDPSNARFVQAMRSNGARFTSLDGYAGNAYNLKGYMLNGELRETITSFVSLMRSQGFSDKPIFLTEIGMFEIDSNPNWTGTKVPRTQALLNLAREIDLMKDDNLVQAYLLFDSFFTNPDPNFQYNVINDSEFPAIIGEECIGNGVTISPSPSVSPSPSASVSPSPSASPSPTASPTVVPTLAACSEQCNTSDDCQGIHTCVDHNSDGIKTCVLISCQAPNALCSPDGCIIGDPVPTITASPTITNSPTLSPTVTASPTVTTTVTPTLSPSPSPTPTGVLANCPAADVNNDDFFNIIDFGAFAKMYGKRCIPVSVSSQCGSIDINGDGLVSIVDYSSFAGRYGDPSCKLN